LIFTHLFSKKTQNKAKKEKNKSKKEKIKTKNYLLITNVLLVNLFFLYLHCVKCKEKYKRIEFQTIKAR
jgi:hypothetical protein